MSAPELETKSSGRGFSVTVAAVVTILIFAGLVWKTRQYTTPPPLNADRAAERAKALMELRAAEADAMTTPGWIDQSKGLVRLPITNAIALVEKNWQNPAKARADLIARVEKATALPPKAPEKPSQFE